jgi:ATP-dependent Clp protease ATP-binding subunit ClpA
MRRVVLDEVRSYFRPELLNRFDDQVRAVAAMPATRR